MRRPILLLVAIIAFSSDQLRAAGPCDAALVRTTYSSFTSTQLDWRLASLVTESEYNEIKHDAGASAVIFGVPVGVDYSDYHARAVQISSSYKESLSLNQQKNILWTALDPNAPTVYAACLQAQVFGIRGLHMAVRQATKTDVSVIASWNPQGNDSNTIKPTWIWVSQQGDPVLPNKLTAGLTIVVLKRPQAEQTFAVNYPGFTDSVVLEPLPPPPIEPPWSVTPETYTSDSLPSGNCGNFSNWYSLASPDKSADWTIVNASFNLIGDRSCASFAHCNQTVDTPIKVAFNFQMQGHSEQCYGTNTGIQNSRGSLTVVWKHHGLAGPGRLGLLEELTKDFTKAK